MSEKLGDLLVQEGLITKEQLEHALEVQRKEQEIQRQRLVKMLLHDKFLTLKEMASLARTQGFEAKLLPKLAEEKKLDRNTYQEIKSHSNKLYVEEIVERGIVSLQELLADYGFVEVIEEAVSHGLIPRWKSADLQSIGKGRLLGQVLISLNYVKPAELNYILDRYRKRKRIGDMLIDAGFITARRFNELLKQRGRSNVPIGEYLVRAGAVKEEELLDVLSKQYNIPLISGTSVFMSDSDKERLRAIITCSYCKRNHILPIQMEGAELTLALRDPRMIKDLSLSALGDFVLQFVLVVDREFRRLFHDLYGEELDVEENPLLQEGAENNVELNLDEGPDDPLLVDQTAAMQDMEAHELVNRILAQGLEIGASDIHVEQDFEGVKLRYRVDGVLISMTDDWIVRKLREKVSGVISRIKIMCDLDIAERRLPQDGSFRMSYRDKKTGQKVNLDFRVATCKATVGENVVVRILDSRTAARKLEELNFNPDVLYGLEKALRNPAGMILVTGPTGSGKSTTLYAALKHVHHPGIKTITAEDPVEYNFPGIMQTQIHPKIGLTFPRLLRSFLRLDPDVILVGEIRDKDTAQIAFDAAQTGHLLLSTLHTNDSFGTLVRLRDLGIDMGQMAESLKAVLAQRLVRTVCEKCKEEYEPDESEWAPIFIGYPSGVTFYRGAGCEECHFTGYKGRMMVSELFVVEQKVQTLIAGRADLDTVRRAAFESGMQTMMEDAMGKLDRTTLAETIRTVPGDLIDLYRAKQREFGLQTVVSNITSSADGRMNGRSTH